jgi:hypothetical protein
VAVVVVVVVARALDAYKFNKTKLKKNNYHFVT